MNQNPEGLLWVLVPSVCCSALSEPAEVSCSWFHSEAPHADSARLLQVNEIYQDSSLGANINVVVARIIMLSGTKVRAATYHRKSLCSGHS